MLVLNVVGFLLWTAASGGLIYVVWKLADGCWEEKGKEKK